MNKINTILIIGLLEQLDSPRIAQLVRPPLYWIQLVVLIKCLNSLRNWRKINNFPEHLIHGLSYLFDYSNSD